MVPSCRSRLFAQVPPLPSVVERPVSYSGEIDDNAVRRPSTCLMTVPITSEEVHADQEESILSFQEQEGSTIAATKTFLLHKTRLGSKLVNYSSSS